MRVYVGGDTTPFAWRASRSRRATVRTARSYGPYRVKPNVPLMKTPIWSRVTGEVGQ